nr:ATP-binding cassette sub-family G member 4-like [Onthophagus taurus]
MYVDIEFKNLTYFISENKKVLSDLNGKFASGELTGILGPSGAGKSTLLNILAGLIHDGVKGDIYINNKPRNNKMFHKISSYIMQDDVVQHHLKVEECLQIAINLKLGKSLSDCEKEKTLKTILKSMCLEQCIQTETQYLSSGQRKRLIIALELVNNPPVIFLDEPTTGLDEITLLSCMKLLKLLTGEGRTIICTIHQPSDNVFNLFDNVYFLVKGRCVYKGKPGEIIPFLNEINLSCPLNYNPADYLIELIAENDEFHASLSNQAKKCKYNENNIQNDGVIWPYEDLPPLWYQVKVLMSRRFKQIFRNKLHLSIEIGHNIFTGFFIGLLFYQMGNNAKTLVNNIFIFYAINNYLMFTFGITLILIYPFEMKILQREYMNRWYNLKAYYLALNLSIFPIPCIGTTILCLLIYYMTGQPTDEPYRFFWFTLSLILYGFASQGFGLVIATIFNPAQGAVVGSTIGVALVLLSICTNGYGDQLSTTMKILTSLSYVYHTYSANLIAILRARGPAICEDAFCYYSSPRDLLKKMGLSENGYFISILYVLFFLVLHRLMAYVILKGRVNPNSKLNKLLKNVN